MRPIRARAQTRWRATTLRQREARKRADDEKWAANQNGNNISAACGRAEPPIAAAALINIRRNGTIKMLLCRPSGPLRGTRSAARSSGRIGARVGAAGETGRVSLRAHAKRGQHWNDHLNLFRLPPPASLFSHAAQISNTNCFFGFSFQRRAERGRDQPRARPSTERPTPDHWSASSPGSRQLVGGGRAQLLSAAPLLGPQTIGMWGRARGETLERSPCSATFISISSSPCGEATDRAADEHCKARDKKSPRRQTKVSASASGARCGCWRRCGRDCECAGLCCFSLLGAMQPPERPSARCPEASHGALWRPIVCSRPHLASAAAHFRLKSALVFAYSALELRASVKGGRRRN